MVKSKGRSPKRVKKKGSKSPERGNKLSSNNTAPSTPSEQDNDDSPAKRTRSTRRASPTPPSSSPSEPKSTGREIKQSSDDTPSSTLKFQSPLPSAQSNNNSPAGRTRSSMSRINTDPNSPGNVDRNQGQNAYVPTPRSEDKSNTTLPGNISGEDPSSSLLNDDTHTPPPKKDDTLLPSPVTCDVNLQHCKSERIAINNTMLPFVYPLYINEKNEIVCSITDTNHNQWDTQTQIRIMMAFLGNPYDLINHDKNTNSNTGPGDDMEIVLLPQCDNQSIWDSIDDVPTINAKVSRPLCLFIIHTVVCPGNCLFVCVLLKQIMSYIIDQIPA